MFEITFFQMLCIISAAWIIARIVCCLVYKSFSLKRELQLLLVYICLIVIARMVYFPLHHIDGRIGTLVFDKAKVVPFKMNLRPFTFIVERYAGWQVNIIGNIAMFVPVGIIWPVCFKKLDRFAKVLLSGFVYTLLIELSQLPFYDRCSDVDDIILNTSGVAIGALIFFAFNRIAHSKSRKHGK